jgi:hypothetical protein
LTIFASQRQKRLVVTVKVFQLPAFFFKGQKLTKKKRKKNILLLFLEEICFKPLFDLLR